MNTYSLKEIFIGFSLTLLLLVGLNIINTSLVFTINLGYYILSFNVIIVIFLNFKIDTPCISFLILIIQYFHSFFTIEKWEVLTISGIILYHMISYLKEFIQLSSVMIIIVLTEIFQCFSFLIVSTILYMALDQNNFTIDTITSFLVRSTIGSLTAPLLFFFLDRIWSFSKFKDSRN